MTDRKRYEITEDLSPTFGDFKLCMVDKFAYNEKNDWGTFDVHIGNYAGSECFSIGAEIAKIYAKEDKESIRRSMTDSMSIPYDHPQSIEWLTKMRDILDRAILEARKAHGEPVTDPRFVRCKCDKYPIWSKADLEWESNEAWRGRDINPKLRQVQCPLCHKLMHEMPDAFVEDIARGGLFATDASFLNAYNISEYYDTLDGFDNARGK